MLLPSQCLRGESEQNPQQMSKIQLQRVLSPRGEGDEGCEDLASLQGSVYQEEGLQALGVAP